MQRRFSLRKPKSQPAYIIVSSGWCGSRRQGWASPKGLLELGCGGHRTDHCGGSRNPCCLAFHGDVRWDPNPATVLSCFSLSPLTAKTRGWVGAGAPVGGHLPPCRLTSFSMVATCFLASFSSSMDELLACVSTSFWSLRRCSSISAFSLFSRAISCFWCWRRIRL